MRDFEGKTAVVTGAASGMGRAFAERFARAGMQVVLADIEQEALDRAVAELRQQEFRVLGVLTNTMKRDSVEALAEKATAEFGNIHMLFNNAGVAARSITEPTWKLAAADWEWVMGVNFWGVVYGLQAFVPAMIAHGEEGHIVNTASIAGLTPMGGPYGASKHAVVAVTEGLYFDLRRAGARISASVLCPGFVNTNIDKAERNRPRELGGSDAAPAQSPGLDSILRLGKAPAEIAEAVYDSVLNDRFYILPNSAWDDVIRETIEHTIGRGAPLTIDFIQLAARTAAGEPF